MREDMKDVLPLFRELPLDILPDAYRKFRENLNSAQRRIVLATIGARFVYGESYLPEVNVNSK